MVSLSFILPCLAVTEQSQIDSAVCILARVAWLHPVSQTLVNRGGQEFEMVPRKLDKTVGAGLVGAREVLTAVYPGLKQPRKGGADIVPIARARSKSGKTGEASRGGKLEAEQIPIRGLIPGMAVHFARCCHPLPGPMRLCRPASAASPRSASSSA